MNDAQGGAAVQATDPLLGRTIHDRFKIVSMIARGGMGRVYRAEQAPLGRICALKVMNAGFGGVDPEFHKRFFLEASISSKLTHPNTVTVFDYGKTDDDIYYMAMELLEGRTLHRALREDGTFPELRMIHIASQVCRSLREAHGHGVIHRDLKPANVFLVTHGDEPDFVKVLDFGLVKNLDERPEEQLTQTGLFMGSPKYMAPEQIEGRRVDPRTDIYSLGVIMYEMITGKVPFERASSVNTLMAHVHDAVPPLRVTNPRVNVSEEVEAIVLRCMSKQVEERFASMDELLTALKNCAVNGGNIHDSRHSWRVKFTSQPARSSASGSGSNPAVSQHPGSPFVPGPYAPHLGASGMPSNSPTPVAISVGASAELDALMARDHSSPYGRKRKSLRSYLGVMVLSAIGLGGGLGYLAYRLSTPSSVSAALTTPIPTASAVRPPSQPPAAPKKVTVRLETSPDGAWVKDDTKELCSATPCSIELEESDAARTRTLSIGKSGFRTESVKTTLGANLMVPLTKASAAPAVGPSARLPWPPSPKGAQSSHPVDEPPTPDGFKKAY
ncbi:MAG: serine/threonine-protein kinase [Polyangiaceae bacterium]